MKYYLIAGEASGDLHGSNLIKHVSINDKEANLRAWGGDKMHVAGAYIVEHYKNLAFMGFAEVIRNLPTILSLIKKCKKDILSFAPDVLILIDYPGFNLRIAKWAKQKRIKIVYYITPQIWAWHKNRVHTLGKYTDLLLVILPFEAAFFKKYGYEATYVGHPLLDAITAYGTPQDFGVPKSPGIKILALLPGSRKQEIRTMLPIMLQACKKLPFQICIAVAPSVDIQIYEDIIHDANLNEKPTLVIDNTYALLSIADCALVSSGTATLETALFEVPQVVCYKGNPISYFIAKRLVDLKYISLVNLIEDKKIVTELIQDELTPQNIITEIHRLEISQSNIKEDYKKLKTNLGSAGASEKAAYEIIKLLNK